jgi:hypothetical protein
MALRVARRALPAYSSKFSKKEFTQPQLFSMLALKQFFRTDYRGIVALLADMDELQQLLGLTKLPHYTTLQKAHDRLLKKGLLPDSSKLFSVLPRSAA